MRSTRKGWTYFGTKVFKFQISFHLTKLKMLKLTILVFFKVEKWKVAINNLNLLGDLLMNLIENIYVGNLAHVSLFGMKEILIIMNHRNV